MISDPGRKGDLGGGGGGGGWKGLKTDLEYTTSLLVDET